MPARVDEILAGRRPEPLPADVAAAIRAVIDGAERRLRAGGRRSSGLVPE